MFRKVRGKIILQNGSNYSVVKQKGIFNVKIHFYYKKKNHKKTKYSCENQSFLKNKDGNSSNGKNKNQSKKNELVGFPGIKHINWC